MENHPDPDPQETQEWIESLGPSSSARAPGGRIFCWRSWSGKPAARVIWGSYWDPLIARDTGGLLLTPKASYVSACLNERCGPVMAASDYMKAYADQIRCFVLWRYVVLGTDGYGRSDTRAELREFFEISRYYIAVAALKTLANEAGVPHSILIETLRKYGVDPENPSPVKT